jgi:hypothetical protein
LGSKNFCRLPAMLSPFVRTPLKKYFLGPYSYIRDMPGTRATEIIYHNK